MPTKETCADEAINTIDFIPSPKQNTVNHIINRKEKGLTAVNKIKAVIHYLLPSHWFDKLLDDFDVDFVEFKHGNNIKK